MSNTPLISTLTRDFLLSSVSAPCVYLPRVETMPSVHKSSEALGTWISSQPEPLSFYLALGAFDGLHRGHQALIDACVEAAHKQGGKALALTFDPDPDEVLTAHPAPKLLDSDDRIRALAQSGVDALLVVPFTPALAALDHVAFFEEVLGDIFPHIASVHVGADFRLGHKGASTVAVMQSWGSEHGIEFVGHELLCERGEPISATRIRTLIAAGELEGAAALTGRHHMVSGCVVRGRGEGRRLGFPTANLELGRYSIMPPDGVYAGWALVGNSQSSARAYPAAINVGLPPMFATDPKSAKLEATLLGFSGDLYGQRLSLLICEQLRPSVRFSSVDELTATVKGNMEDVRARFGDEAVLLAP